MPIDKILENKEELSKKLYKLWCELKLEDKTSFEEIPAVIQLENFIKQELSNLKKSIREEIGGKKEEIMEYYKNYDNTEMAVKQALDEILSLKSLE